MKKPNIVRTVVSVAACKCTRFVLRKTGRGGTALPGIVAMKLGSNVLSAVSEGMKLIVVTGTNGKTTTCNMIEHAVSSQGKKTLRDKSGANMLHGIAADLICNASWLGRSKYEYAVIECDEAALKLLVDYVQPAAIVVTNLFSDQVDRYGGVQNTLKEIRTGVEKSPKSVLVLNADEPLSASLSLNVPNKVIWYGLEKAVGVQGVVDLSDAGTCQQCGGEYEYDYHVYAHLGGFRCPKCGYHRQDPDVAVTSIDEITPEGSRIHIRTVSGQTGRTQAENAGQAAASKMAESGGKAAVSRMAEAGGKTADSMNVRAPKHLAITREAHIALPAVYNVYNAAAATAAVTAVGLDAGKALDSLASVHSAFGRMETFRLGDNTAQMILVKNPAGCNQAFSYLTGFEKDFTVVLCLNNRTGDGHDISWIESTDYEKLCADPHVKKMYVGGECAQQLRDRLVKAGAKQEKMEMITDYHALLEELKAEKDPIFVLPNYTAMMDLRPILSEATDGKDFWE